MSNPVEGGIKGALIAAAPSLMYSMADRPAEGLLTMAIGVGAGVTHSLMKNAGRRETTANRKSEFYDAHGKAVGIEGAYKWGEEVGKD